MSETGEIVKGTIAQIAERLDALAAKLGIAAENIWRFTVAAKVVEAKRDFAKFAAEILLVALLFGWAGHVARMKLPHDISTEVHTNQIQTSYSCKRYFRATPTAEIRILDATCLKADSITVPVPLDHGLSIAGWIYVATVIICAILGLISLIDAVQGMIYSIAAVKTAEYDAFQDLLSDLKD